MVLQVKECLEAEVRLIEGSAFYESQENMLKFLLSVDDDRMLYNFRRASGLDTKGAKPLDGWDAPDGKLRGHTTGHYLSALALCYWSTGNERIKEKAIYIVDVFGECQDSFSGNPDTKEGFLSAYSEEQFDLLEKYTTYPTIWAPYYTLHKILAGLLDCYSLIHYQKALQIAERIGMWAWNRLSRLPHKQLTKMWGLYIAGEFGGMNAAMAELYMITGKEEFLKCARLFDNDNMFGPLTEKKDALGNMHANQHIPQMIGALRLYEATGEKRYFELAEFFWKIVVSSHCYANGGTGEGEIFHESGKIGTFLNEKTIETCASYNMLKLTKELYQYFPDVSYMDYYERTVLNHILATQDEEVTGESTYFFPLGPGMRREFLFENSCCHGTGMESRFKYREGIYFYDDTGDIYINLFIPSKMWWEEKDIFVKQETNRCTPEKIRIFIKGSGLNTVKIRIPCWTNEYRIIENGKEITEVPCEKGYLILSRDFSQETEIELEFPYHFQIIRTPDEPEKAAVQYGPYIMAALSEQKEFLRLSFSETGIEKKMMPTEDPLQFECEGYRWIPLCEVGTKAYHTYVICPME